MSVTPEQVKAGQAIYTKRTLTAYDFFVLGFSNRFVWKCPTEQLVAHYNKHLSGNHLDVGVGTGYFLEKCKFPTSTPRVALMDANVEALEYASRRIRRLKPEVYRRNVLEPISLDADKFDSVGINYLLHCLPGTMETKSDAISHLRTLMNPGGVLFGATLLHSGVPRSFLAKALMKVYNKKGVFSNENDSLESLESVLNGKLKNCSVEVVGCVALFSGQV